MSDPVGAIRRLSAGAGECVSNPVRAIRRLLPGAAAREVLSRPAIRTAGRKAGLAAVATGVSAAAWWGGPAGRRYRPEQVRRILAIRLDPLGDLLLTRPALAALRLRFPTARLDLLALPYTAPIGRLFPEIDACYAFDVHQLRPSGSLLNARNHAELRRLIGSLRAGEYDLAIAFCGQVASFFAWASGARWRIGFAGEAARHTLTTAVPGRRYLIRRHEAEYGLTLAAAAGSTVRAPFTPIPIPPEVDRRWAAEIPEWWSAGRPRVVLHPGASNGWAKRWTPEGFAELARFLSADRGARVAVTGSAGEASLTADIAALAGPGPIDLAGRLDLTGLAAALARADVVVCGDSGPLHLATQLGRPVVGIYGPSDPVVYGPFEGPREVVRLDLPCSPCYDATAPAICPLVHHRCMRDLPCDAVAAAVDRLLDARGPVAAEALA